MMLQRFFESGMTDVILSIISYTFSGMLMFKQYSKGVAAEAMNSMPDWLVWLLVIVITLSVAFMNIAKGISNLRGRKKKSNSPYRDK